MTNLGERAHFPVVFLHDWLDQRSGSHEELPVRIVASPQYLLVVCGEPEPASTYFAFSC